MNRNYKFRKMFRKPTRSEKLDYISLECNPSLKCNPSLEELEFDNTYHCIVIDEYKNDFILYEGKNMVIISKEYPSINSLYNEYDDILLFSDSAIVESYIWIDECLINIKDALIDVKTNYFKPKIELFIKENSDNQTKNDKLYDEISKKFELSKNEINDILDDGYLDDYIFDLKDE